MELQLAELQQAFAALVEQARVLQATHETARDAVLAEAKQQAAHEVAQMKAEARGHCRQLVEQAERRHARLVREATAMSELRQHWDSGTVRLDVGGHKYTTSVATLRRVPDSMLDSLVSGRFALTQTEEQCVFIDRDGALFPHVLDWLRDGTLDLAGLDALTLRRLRREFLLRSPD
jgi:hypothetical protein